MCTVAYTQPREHMVPILVPAGPLRSKKDGSHSAGQTARGRGQERALHGRRIPTYRKMQRMRWCTGEAHSERGASTGAKEDDETPHRWENPLVDPDMT